MVDRSTAGDLGANVSQPGPSKRTSLFESKLVLDALRIIRAPNQVVELRVLEGVTGHGGWPATWNGYFHDPEQLVASLSMIQAATGVYITVNPINPSLLARANNRLRKAEKGGSTTDLDVLSRRWMLIDTDARRPSGISASDAEHENALRRAAEIQAYLTGEGWPEPIVADSGNGGHLMYRIDQPVDDGGLIQRCLAALAARFDDEQVNVDTTVFNPSRIWKLYGTRACKGDSTPDRPHRLAKILSSPPSLAVVPDARLNQLAGEISPPERKQQSHHGLGGDFDIEQFIAQHGLDVEGPHDWSGQQGPGRRWTLKKSPLCDHHDGAAFILQHASGAITARCHHNSCSWGWPELRQQLSGVDRDVDTTSPKSRNRRDSRSNVNVSTVNAMKLRTPPAAYRPFPVEKFPAPVGTFIGAAAAAIGCDPAFVALPILACLARAIGNNRVVRLKSSWMEPAILWAAIVGKSGTQKSPALKIATKILQHKQEEAFESCQQDLAEYEINRAEYERDLQEWKRKKRPGDPPWEPKAPTARRYLVGDITIEALADRLANQYDGVLVVCDELAGWINGMGQYKGGRKSADTGYWLSTWSAAAMSVDRKTGDRKTIHIPRASVSIVGGIQPDILRSALGSEHLQDGMCARLLLAMPPARFARWSEAVVPFETERAISEVFDQLLRLEPAADASGRPAPFPLDLSPEARDLWIAYYDRHREEQLDLDDDLAAAWSKLEAYTARFSLIFQLCGYAAGLCPEAPIDDVSMRSAIAVSDWFAWEAKRVYALLAETKEERQHRELIELIRRKGESVTARDLMRSSRRFASAAEAEAALNELFLAGVGRWEWLQPGRQGGRPTRRFLLVDSVDIDQTS